jgi:hypothetical protein
MVHWNLNVRGIAMINGHRDNVYDITLVLFDAMRSDRLKKIQLQWSFQKSQIHYLLLFSVSKAVDSTPNDQALLPRLTDAKGRASLNR